MITCAPTSCSSASIPAHGGEILDLVDLRTGRQLLGRPPFGSNLPILGGDLDEDDAGRESYRGGWQTVLPNAGNACDNANGTITASTAAPRSTPGRPPRRPRRRRS